RRLVPSASAASTSARLVRLLEPGGVILAANGRVTGWIVTSGISRQKVRPPRGTGNLPVFGAGSRAGRPCHATTSSGTVGSMTLFTESPGGYFVAHNATIVGDVLVGELSSFWFNAVVRGDVAPVTIGGRVNVQDAAVIHCDSGVPNVIEDDVTIGHGAIVHGMLVGAGSLIGMGATLLSRTKI